MTNTRIKTNISGGKKGKSASSRDSKPRGHQIKSSKDGGSLGDDLKTLAVPFAILLAKQGLEGKKKKTKQESVLKGGSCGPCNGAGAAPPHMVGGKLHKLSKAIDNFLKKY